jgi:phosphate starvation-inducible PhoH-like protein
LEEAEVHRLEIVVKLPAGPARMAVLGSADRNLKLIREGTGVRVSSRAGDVRLSGNRHQVAAARLALERLGDAADRDEALDRPAVLDLIARSISQVEAEMDGRAGGASEHWSLAADGPPWTDRLDVYVRGQSIRARTDNQQVYLDAIRDNDVVFGIGPAGTGKTYLAVACAVHLLKIGRIKKIILARPAVEAGEKLGFLPGDLQAKVNPYLRPLFDALNDMMDFNTIKRFMLSDVVEVVPLAYMRGRTLNRSVIILDEAQNTTRGQMKMFLTRMGEASKVIINGDTTQIDLPNPAESGLVDAARVLRRVPGLAMVTFGEADIVRNPMVQKIVEAYARFETGPARPRGGGMTGKSEHKLNKLGEEQGGPPQTGA